ncbi:MAG: hypothetical protein JWQ40_4412 [Segetibacter sp.]|jgi:hypothetical protein|nr:hypothetical protein [Segetibacter sp.]
MKPLNQQEINKAIRKFLFHFFCIVLASLISTWFFYQTIRYDLRFLSAVSSSTENSTVIQNQLNDASSSISAKLKAYNTGTNNVRLTEELKDETQKMNELIKSDASNGSLEVYKRVYAVIPYVMTVKDSINEVSHERENLQKKYDQLLGRQLKSVDH